MGLCRRDDYDYDIDFYTVGPVPPDIIESHAPQPSPREQLEVRPSPLAITSRLVLSTASLFRSRPVLGKRQPRPRPYPVIVLADQRPARR